MMFYKLLFMLLVFFNFAVQAADFDTISWIDTMRRLPAAVTEMQPPNTVAMEYIAKIRQETSSNYELITAIRDGKEKHDIVKILTSYAASPLRIERIDSTISLANIVDSSTVCHILGYLKSNSNKINDNGRYNLLQIVFGVSSYAFKDVAVWILQTMQDVIYGISNQKAMYKTEEIISIIQKTASNRVDDKIKSLEKDNIDDYMECQKTYFQK